MYIFSLHTMQLLKDFYMNYAVIGLGYGDEGKGHIVNDICKKQNIHAVVRFQGGHQCGHTVYQNGIKHVFSNFGSGSIFHIPTYWTKYCTIHPTGIINELKILKTKGITPTLVIDPLCPVTTPYDILFNQQQEYINKHGSVGVGFGSTIARHEGCYKLFALDLLCDDVLNVKLNAIASYYKIKPCHDEFINNIKEMLNYPSIHITKILLDNISNYVFEGGQGILLDQDHGFFPNVTRSYTTSRNIFELYKEFNLYKAIEINYVTRCYLTRHGNGYLPFEDERDNIISYPNENETNVYNRFQGKFRYAPLNMDLICHSLYCDKQYHSTNIEVNKLINITCLDQVKDDKILLVKNNKLTEQSIHDIKFKNVKYHYSP